MAKRGPKFFSPLKAYATSAFKVVMARAVEFDIYSRGPLKKEEKGHIRQNAELRFGSDSEDFDRPNTNYSSNTIKRYKDEASQIAYGKAWPSVKNSEKGLPALAQKLGLVKSMKEARTIYNAPLKSTNKVIYRLRGHSSNPPSSEEAWDILLKLNVSPDHIWPKELHSHTFHLGLLAKFRQAIVAREVVGFDATELHQLEMIGRYGPCAGDEWDRGCENILHVLVNSIAPSLGGIEGFFHRLAKLSVNGIVFLQLDQEIYLVIKDGENRRTVTLAELESLFCGS